jgi:hypothetical protein
MKKSYAAEQHFITSHTKFVVGDVYSGMNGFKGATRSKATMQLFKTAMIQDKGTASTEAVFISKY